MTSFIEQVRQVVAGFWAEDARRVASLADVTAQHAAGVYSDEFLAKQQRKAGDARAEARRTASAKLDEIQKQFDTALARWSAPDAAVLSDPDFRMLQNGIVFEIADFRALCRRHRDDGAMYGALEKYAAAHGWAPYFSVDVPSPAKRKQAFAKAATRARQDLAAENAAHAVAVAPAMWAHYLADSAAVLGLLDTCTTPPGCTPWERQVAAAGGLDAMLHAETERALLGLRK